ncbi:hypothetical protein EJ06DRAFT_585351 [Trichodelitschia bisporula]|uniref:RING-type domain-containing protein n=1 Tax=Trichodelitschia bisporula TaxID=703511 RepID=A0A6G1HJR9_9PEZI|nr:hypothetical protein EJ06DRAFT_585351 [Trichodelitschia bisporula]
MLLLFLLTLAVAAFASITPSITPSNASLPAPHPAYLQIQLARIKTDTSHSLAGYDTTFPPFNLAYLTPAANTSLPANGIRGSIFNLTDADLSNVTALASTHGIAVVSCDPGSVRGFLSVEALIRAIIPLNYSAIILYSRGSSSCAYAPPSDFPPFDYVYSMTDNDEFVRLGTALLINERFGSWAVARKSAIENSTSTSNGNYAPSIPGGPSPSTAVAMIILYSITGVITALFLVIIVTGAIRAHRHPERYGPRNVLGRPRQSRARGLARAMLDTLPIVKFGEKDEPKSTDVELSLAARDSVGSAKPSDIGSATAGASAVTGASATPEPAAPVEDSQGCSICTEDFERGQDVRVLPCNHSFHPACIDPWLLNVSGTCPLCRIDLRPSSPTSSPTALPPPLDDVEHNSRTRRLSGLLDNILNPRHMQEASPAERIAALRTLREQRRGTPEQEAEARRRRRLTIRLQDTFRIRTRTGLRGGSPERGGSAGEGMGMGSVPEEGARREESSTGGAQPVSGPSASGTQPWAPV